MTDSTDAQGQDPNADAGQDPNSNGSGDGGQDSQATGFDALPPETQKEIKALRKEAAGYRKKVEDYENANKTELEKREAAVRAAEERAAKAEAKARTLSARSAVNDAATKLNAISPRAVFALIEDDLEYDEQTGEPTNIAALLKKAQAEEPSLFRASAGSGDGGKGNGQSTQTNDINSLIRSMAQQAT